MDVKQRYIREAGYDVDEYFVEQLQHLDIRTGIKIAKFIEKNVDRVPDNSLVSTVIPGLIIDDTNTPVTFAVEMIRDKSPHLILSDLQLITMDNYLDLFNLNKKLNALPQSQKPKTNNRRRLQD
tara:strand:+ start:260 stop:631 length:372 start_codon:yes stop_codon:yes gene_type:complete